MKKYICVFLFLIFSLNVNAYVYQPQYVYSQWFDATKKVQTLSYEKVYRNISGGSAQGAQVEKIEKVYIKRNGMLRIYNESEQVDKRVSTTQVFVSSSGGKRASTFSDVVDPLELVWLFNNEDAFMVRVNQFFVPTNQFQWFLFQGEKHWMQGRKDQQFLLFSADDSLLKLAKKGERIFQFFYSTSPSTLPTMPSKVIVFKDNKPQTEILIRDLQINPNIPSNYFSNL